MIGDHLCNWQNVGLHRTMLLIIRNICECENGVDFVYPTRHCTYRSQTYSPTPVSLGHSPLQLSGAQQAAVRGALHWWGEQICCVCLWLERSCPFPQEGSWDWRAVDTLCCWQFQWILHKTFNIHVSFECCKYCIDDMCSSVLITKVQSFFYIYIDCIVVHGRKQEGPWGGHAWIWSSTVCAD